MKQVLVLTVLGALASCTIHLHVHESPEKPARATEGAKAARPAGQEDVDRGSVAGVVVDEAGRPVRAHVAAVGQSGSIGMGTGDDGRFEIQELHWPEFVLTASTEDGRLSVLPDVVPGSDELELVVRPASVVTIRIEGTEDVRCAFFHDGSRIEDFTLRPSKPARVVVPAGEVSIRLYVGDEIKAEQMIRLHVGDEAQVGFGAL